MRLTKKKALELSIEKWTDHVETGEKNITQDWHERHGYPMMESDCALCEYQTRRGKDDEDCEQCPYRQKFGHCMETIYGDWVCACSPEDQKKYASEFLAQLKELE